MERLWTELLGYMRIYQSRIIPVLLLGGVLGIIFFFVVKKGDTKYTEKPASTIISGLLLSISIAVVIVMTLYDRGSGEEFVFRLQLFGSYIDAFQRGSVETL